MRKSPTLEYATQWIEFFEWCDAREIAPSDAYEAVRDYQTKHGHQAKELPLGSLSPGDTQGKGIISE
jgi:hypothetical protein